MVETTIRDRRHSGWSQSEADMLWETADEAQQQGLPLKAVFEQIAQRTGRRPNSIRNYYYAQVQKRLGDQPRPARFVPFTGEEVEKLLEEVLMAKAQGHSVRSCLQRMSGGDHSLMLRYQNKYRSVIKTRPDLVNRVVEKLRGQGLSVCAPQVHHRTRTSLNQACQELQEDVRLAEDPELARALQTIAALVREKRQVSGGALGVRLDLYRIALEDKQKTIDQLTQSAQALILALKEFLGQSQQMREGQLSAFCASISERMGLLEQRLEELHPN